MAEQDVMNKLVEALRLIEEKTEKTSADGSFDIGDVVEGRWFPGSFHNAAVDESRRGGFEAAYRVVAAGLEMFPKDPDLLADALFYCKSGDKANRHLKTLLELDRSKMTWRSFDFAIDYLVDILANLGAEPSEVKVIYEAALKLAEEFVSNLPDDERAYVAKIKVLESRGSKNDEDEVEELYRDLVFHDSYDGMQQRSFPKPQLCMGYATQLLKRGEYEDAIKAATVGLVGSAQEQPSVSEGVLNYIRALARDALLQKESIQNDSAFADLEKVEAILKDYKIARRSVDNPTYIANIKYRMRMLAILVG